MALYTVIGVMGSGSSEHADLAEPLGVWIAKQGYSLLTGGRGGVMTAVSRAFHSVQPRKGVVIGVLPARASANGDIPRPNSWVEVAIITHLPKLGVEGTHRMSRNHINVLSSNVIVALPGGHGTQSEIKLALQYNRPVISFLRASDTDLGGAPVARTLSDVKKFIRSKCR